MGMDEVDGEKPGLVTGLFVDKFESFLRAPICEVQVLVQMPGASGKAVAVHAVGIGSTVPGGAVFTYIGLIVVVDARDGAVGPFGGVKTQFGCRRAPVGFAG